jgi:hypothetical protein
VGGRRKEEIIKIRVEINERGYRKTVERLSDTKS